MEQPDIFDRIMHWKPLRPLEPVYKKYKEMLLYVFFGGLTFLVSVITYALFTEVLGMNILAGNAVSWVLAVLFAFFTNRTWVFDGKTKGTAAFLLQMAGFFAGRFFTLIVEEVILYVFIERMHFNSMLIKIIAQVVIIILNYIISKLLIFKKKA